MESLLVSLGLLFAFINGFEGCSVITSIASSRSMRPPTAIAIACVAEFFGALSLGTAVALTLGKGILAPAIFDLAPAVLHTVLLGALLGAIMWNLIAWLLALPTSSSHALIGGLVGGGTAMAGLKVVLWQPLLIKVIIPLLLTPILGFVIAFLLMKILTMFLRNFPPGINFLLKRIQLGSMVFLAASHGSNGSQKAMGVIALALAAAAPHQFHIPFWVMAACATAIALGLSLGGWRVMKILSKQVSKLTPLHSLDSQLASGLIIYLASLLGSPVSTSQIVGSSIIGAGAGFRITSIRWNVTKSILSSWLITMPLSAALAILMTLLIKPYLR